MKARHQKKRRGGNTELPITVLQRLRDHHLDVGLKKIGKSIAHVLNANKTGDKVRETNYENVFVPGIIDYDSQFIQAFKASIHRDKGISNSKIDVLLCLSEISSIEKKQFKCGVYNKGPVYEFWIVWMKNSLEYSFEYKTGLAIVELWKRFFREGRWNMQEDMKINKNLLKQLKDDK